ncbi:unnamed protein product, partial [Pocillopora meandrina]
QKVQELGIKPDNAVKLLNKVVTASTECERANEAAEDILKLRDGEKLKVIDEKITAIDKILSRRESLISERKKADLIAEKSSLEDRKEGIQKDLQQSDPQSLRRLQQRKQRLAKTLIDENRVKRRKLGAGAKKSLDTEDEEFIARSIEETSTAHGRRHDTVLYSHHPVKKCHFLSLANYNLYRRGKKLIKSATTVLNRSRPKNINSRAAKAHCGKSLFCSKKPPKTETELGLATHHQRAHIRNCKFDMFKEENRARSLMISFDDKAYIRPGSDVGARNVKKGVIYDVSDPSKQKALPQHDFTEAKVHQTPSSFRFLRGKVATIDGEQKFIHEDDQTIVTVLPKSYVGSSGSVWASDQLKIKWEVPQVFEQSPISPPNDVMCVTSDINCQFKEYEMKKLKWLKNQLSEAVSIFHEEKETLIHHEVASIINDIQEVNDDIDKTSSTLSANTIWEHQEKAVNLCDTAIAFINSLKLPPLCDHILQATDAGPGVGVTNIEVKYRDIEMSRINSWTHVNRIHRAPHDSGQNEAERSNTAIGEALVDGRALHWEYFHPTDLISEEELKTLTVEEMKELEAEVVERNAWRVAQDVVSRIDGQNYFKKLDDLIESCMITGEMFHEYCENESVGPTPRPVPDINKLPKYHYLPVAEIPITNTDDGKRREVDDYHPRARLKQAHKKNEINIKDSASVQTFSNRYIVEESLVRKYLAHLNHLEMMSGKRKMEKKNKNLKENTMSYEE